MHCCKEVRFEFIPRLHPSVRSRSFSSIKWLRHSDCSLRSRSNIPYLRVPYRSGLQRHQFSFHRCPTPQEQKDRPNAKDLLTFVTPTINLRIHCGIHHHDLRALAFQPRLRNRNLRVSQWQHLHLSPKRPSLSLTVTQPDKGIPQSLSLAQKSAFCVEQNLIM